MKRFWIVVSERNETMNAIPRQIGTTKDDKRWVYDFDSEETATSFAEKQAKIYPSDFVYVMESIKCSEEKK